MTHVAALTATIVHFAPVPNETGPAWKRVATCGVATRVGGAVFGSSTLAYVNCEACLARVVPWAPRFERAG